MDFLVSKLFWLIFPPLNLVIWCLLIGVALWRHRKEGSRFFMTLGIVLFAACGIMPTGKLMLQGLENSYPRPQVPQKFTGILVLGGAFDVEVSQARQTPTFYGSAERVTETLRLMHDHPEAIVLFSGGNGTLNTDLSSEADVFRTFMTEQGIRKNRIYYETKSRNTYENIVFSQAMAKPGPREVWLLVTSAAHMPRAMAIMQKQGWPGIVIPYPVDYQTTGTAADFRFSTDVLGTFGSMHQAMREYLALLAYRIGGKID